VGIDDPVPLDEEMENTDECRSRGGPRTDRTRFPWYLAVLIPAVAVYLGCIVSPPSLMDDVDAVQAQIARTMLVSGDWVTARLDGVVYLEKAPLIYWAIAGCYRVLGVSDWVARLPVALSSIVLCLLTALFGAWAFGKRAGMLAGLCLSTCLGLFLFTRVQIPDVMLTATTALAMWAFLRALDESERHPRLWAAAMAVSLGLGLLLKSLVGLLFPVAAGVIYLALTRQLFAARTWRRLRPFSGLLILLAIAAPWHILAAIRNPPLLDLTLRSAPSEYHGFLWFFFINEQLLRFLNLRYPRDYNTVPVVCFWLFHLLWLFPWSVYFPAVAKLSFRPADRVGQTRLLALCWTGFVLVFFTFSTTQEYYSMPCYPALALLLGSAMAAGGAWIRRATRLLSVIAAGAACALFALAFAVWSYPTPGDIFSALHTRPGTYTLSLDHIKDLTLPAFAYLRVPIVVAGGAFLVGAVGMFLPKGRRAFLAIAVMMVLFLHAARLALVVFDPYLSSRPLAEALLHSLDGELIVDHHYYTFSSIFFYTDRTALLLNGRTNNLIYGSYAPGAPPVFIDDAHFADLWRQSGRYYLVAAETARSRLEKLVGDDLLTLVAQSGGKMLLTNHPLRDRALPQRR
jgi:4-amino-4-deoxy-L-arabinose transferase-like glycosyltransferase